MLRNSILRLYFNFILCPFKMWLNFPFFCCCPFCLIFSPLPPNCYTNSCKWSKHFWPRWSLVCQLRWRRCVQSVLFLSWTPHQVVNNSTSPRFGPLWGTSNYFRGTKKKQVKLALFLRDWISCLEYCLRIIWHLKKLHHQSLRPAKNVIKF